MFADKMARSIFLTYYIMFISSHSSQPTDLNFHLFTESYHTNKNTPKSRNTIYETANSIPETSKGFASKISVLSNQQNLNSASISTVNLLSFLPVFLNHENSQIEYPSVSLINKRQTEISDIPLQQPKDQSEMNKDNINQQFKITNSTFRILTLDPKDELNSNNETNIGNNLNKQDAILAAVFRNNKTGIVDETSTIFGITKVSTQMVKNETDVEFLKYNGYISTKLYRPLCDNECDELHTHQTSPNNTTFNPHEDFSTENGVTFNMPIFTQPTSTFTTNAKSGKISHQDLEVFINALDEHVATLKNKNSYGTPRSEVSENVTEIV